MTRWTVRFALIGFALAFIAVLLVKNKIEDIWDQYSVTAYINASWQNYKHNTTSHGLVTEEGAGDKVIVMAKLEKEKTDWVASLAPSWQAAIYTVDSTSSHANTTLTTPANKGHEAMAYLTYIISNYAALPATMAFIHPHLDGFLSAWHTDTPLHSNLDALRTLQIPFVQKNGYVNLRCNWNPGCLPAHRHNAHVNPEVWRDLFRGTSTEGAHIPSEVGAACCAQFAVSRDQVQKRPLSDYESIRKWIEDTEMSDAKSGRVLEFLWHVIFGKDAVYCPVEELCYCNVYGRC